MRGSSTQLVRAASTTRNIVSSALLSVFLLASFFHYSHALAPVLRLSECLNASVAESSSIIKLCSCTLNDQQLKTFTCGNGSESLGDLFKALKSSPPSPLGFVNTDVKIIIIKGNASDTQNEVGLRSEFFSHKSFERINLTNLKLSIYVNFRVYSDSPNRLGIFDKLNSSLTLLNLTNAGVDATMLNGFISTNEDDQDPRKYKIQPALVAGLPNLRELILDMNIHIKDPVPSSPSEAGGADQPAWFNGLSGLHLLSLAGNDLTSWTRAMKTESSIQKLNLAGNCFGNVNNFVTAWGEDVIPSLEELDFSSRDLSNSSPPGSCPAQKTTSFPSEFCARFPGIKRVLIRHSELELRNDTEPGNWQNCRNLEELDFSFAKSVKITSDVLSRIVPQVKILKFRGSRVEKLDGPVFRRLNLTAFDLTGVPLNGVAVPSDIFSEASVDLLKLSKNSLTMLEPQILSPLSSSLRVLDLSWNPLLNVNAVLKRLTNLNRVILSDMQLSSLSGDTFNSTNTLEKIDLSRNSLVELDDAIFPNSSSIKEIILRNNVLTRIPSSVKQQNLINLDLSHNQLTTFADDLVDFFSNLDLNRAVSINLAGNPWNCSCNLNKLNLWLRDPKGYERVCNESGTGNCPACAAPASGKTVYLNDKDIFNVCTPTTTAQPGQSTTRTASQTGTASPVPSQNSSTATGTTGSAVSLLFSTKLNSWLTVLFALQATFALIR